MSYSMIYLLLVAGTWCLVIGEFSLGQFALGLIFGGLFLFITKAGAGHRTRFRDIPRRLLYLVIYLLILIPIDVFKSNIDLARRLLRKTPAIRPGIVRVELGEITERASALISHAITMTPGELVIDYSKDGRTIYVHLIDAEDAEGRRTAFWRLYYAILQRIIS